MMQLIAAILRYLASVLESSSDVVPPVPPNHALHIMAALIPTPPAAAAPQPSATAAPQPSATAAPPSAATAEPQTSDPAGSQPSTEATSAMNANCIWGCRRVFLTTLNVQSGQGKFHHEQSCHGLRKARSPVVAMPLCSATLHGHTACTICAI